jgi:hypothetical protein
MSLRSNAVKQVRILICIDVDLNPKTLTGISKKCSSPAAARLRIVHARNFGLIGSSGMTGIIIAGETFNVLIEGDESKEDLMLSNPMGTNLHLWVLKFPLWPNVSG